MVGKNVERTHLRGEEGPFQSFLLSDHIYVSENAVALGPVSHHAVGPVRRISREFEEGPDRVRVGNLKGSRVDRVDLWISTCSSVQYLTRNSAGMRYHEQARHGRTRNRHTLHTGAVARTTILRTWRLKQPVGKDRHNVCFKCPTDLTSCMAT